MNKVLKLYYDKHFQTNAVKILPGEYFATADQLLLVTVLGSCVSVCLRDEAAQVSGMNHFLLPTNNTGQNEVIAESARYGANAMELLINGMLKLGAQKSRLKAKVFGGANVLRSVRSSNIGELNAEFTLAFLNAENIPVIAQDVLGELPRKIYFFPSTGEVKVKKLRTLHNETLISREQDYQKSLVAKPDDDISLFE